MHRRAYLAASTGLSASTTMGVLNVLDEENDTDENGTCPPSEAEERSSGDNGEAEIELVEDELVIDDSGFSTDAFVEATIENGGDSPSGQIDLEIDWYDDDGNYLTDNREWLQILEPGERWVARVFHIGDSEDVADYELEIEVGEDRPTAPDGFVLEESEMDVGDRSAEIRGLIANETGSEISYVEAIAIVYDEECTVLGSGRTNETEIPAEETWAFDISWHDRDRLDEVASHRIVVADSVF